MAETPTINISPAAELREIRAQLDWMRSRNLLLSQAVSELQEQVAAAQEDIAALKPTLEEPPETTYNSAEGPTDGDH